MNLHFCIHLGAVGPNKATLPLFFMSLSTHLFIPLRILNNKLYNWNATKLKLSFTMLNWTDWFEFLHFLSTYKHLQKSIRTGRTWNTLSWSKYITIKHIFILQLSKAISQSALQDVSRSLRAKKVWRQSFKWMRGWTVYSWKMKIWGGGLIYQRDLDLSVYFLQNQTKHTQIYLAWKWNVPLHLKQNILLETLVRKSKWPRGLEFSHHCCSFIL